MPVRHFMPNEVLRAVWGLQVYSGWIGEFTRRQAPGAYPNGARVVKTNSKSDDIHQDGALAIVLGSVYESGLGYGYFLEWDNQPYRAVFITGDRIVAHRLDS
jgi:hypothetical protein